MARDIKFTSSGVPYILEFGNVSFAPSGRKSPSPSSSSSSFCYIDSPPPPPRLPSFSLLSPTSLLKRKSTRTPPKSAPEPPVACTSGSAKPLPVPPPPGASETNGIRIKFPSECGHPRMSRKERLVHLQQTISVAVLNAGMSRSPGNTQRPQNHSDRNVVHGSRQYRTPDALFCGTYGQLMAALEGAGLSATPCAGDVSRYTRLGALFVARNDGASDAGDREHSRYIPKAPHH